MTPLEQAPWVALALVWTVCGVIAFALADQEGETAPNSALVAFILGPIGLVWAVAKRLR